jgi:hypothetical protein
MSLHPLTLDKGDSLVNASADLTVVKEPPVRTGYYAEWAPEIDALEKRKI